MKRPITMDLSSFVLALAIALSVGSLIGSYHQSVRDAASVSEATR